MTLLSDSDERPQVNFYDNQESEENQLDGIQSDSIIMNDEDSAED
jgi:hypothetical protein